MHQPLQPLTLCLPRAKECSSKGSLCPLLTAIVSLPLQLSRQAQIAAPVVQQETTPAMANFPIDLAPFIPPALHIEDGGPLRISRSFVNLSSNVVHAHEEYVIAVDTFQVLDQEDIHPFMHQVSEYIIGVRHLQVRLVYSHPFGIGLYQLDTTFHKDLLLEGNPHVIDGVGVTFINQDHALNRRVMKYIRYG
jgi:hypothetical protein